MLLKYNTVSGHMSSVLKRKHTFIETIVRNEGFLHISHMSLPLVKRHYQASQSVARGHAFQYFFFKTWILVGICHTSQACPDQPKAKMFVILQRYQNVKVILEQIIYKKIYRYFQKSKTQARVVWIPNENL